MNLSELRPPKEAIQFRQITIKRTRYHHPAIEAEELFRNPGIRKK